MEKPQYPMRINKYMAHQGISTRRGADELISKRKVMINGRVAVLGDKVERDDVVELSPSVTGKKYDYFAYYKGADETANDDKGALITFLNKTNMFPAGQLERGIEGLMILTNDGRLTERMLSGNHEREYVIETKKPYSLGILKKITDGLYIENDKTMGAKAEEINEDKFKLILKDEKKHEVRRILSHFGYEPKEIKRTRIANITSSGMLIGNTKPIKGAELEKFLTLLGLRNI
jgi:23S rRNA pseudouridine2604 synthase